MYKVLVFLILLFCCLFLFEKKGYCQSDFDFVTRQIKKNYFALQLNTDSIKFKAYVEELKKENNVDSFLFLSKIASYFNDPRLILVYLSLTPLEDSISRDKNTLSQIYHKQFAKDRNIGFWINDKRDCCIFICRSPSSSQLKGYVIKTSYPKYLGKPNIEFTSSEKDITFAKFTYLEQGFFQFAKLKWINPNKFQIGNYERQEKLKSYNEVSAMQLKKAPNLASLKQVSKHTILFTIPACSDQNIAIVDSLVHKFKQELSTTRNLIVDIRNNGGGNPRVYKNLLPYIYTDTIRKGEGYTYVSDELIAYQEKILKLIDSSSKPLNYLKQKQWISDLKKRLAHPPIYERPFLPSRLYKKVSAKIILTC